MELASTVCDVLVKFKHIATHLSKVGDGVQYINSNEEPSELCRSQLPYHYQDTLEEEDKQTSERGVSTLCRHKHYRVYAYILRGLFSMLSFSIGLLKQQLCII